MLLGAGAGTETPTWPWGLPTIVPRIAPPARAGERRLGERSSLQVSAAPLVKLSAPCSLTRHGLCEPAVEASWAAREGLWRCRSLPTGGDGGRLERVGVSLLASTSVAPPGIKPFLGARTRRFSWHASRGAFPLRFLLFHPSPVACPTGGSPLHWPDVALTAANSYIYSVLAPGRPPSSCADLGRKENLARRIRPHRPPEPRSGIR